ncbi:hypothetical protein [Aquimarina longa]|uniref:hypothetical protein n=1 Tax=Aquimarina longa TaxID=1080221 RepID=UPI000782E198|nr:hypothetical protein [Aquimarina longa]
MKKIFIFKTGKGIYGKDQKKTIPDDFYEIPISEVVKFPEYSLRFLRNSLSLLRNGKVISSEDLSVLLDDSNLARLVSGILDKKGIATFKRNDNTTFTVDFSSLIIANSSTGLEAIDEGKGIGYRLKGRNSNFHGDIGEKGIDMSFGNSQALYAGAFGKYSMAIGQRPWAQGNGSFAFGGSSTKPIWAKGISSFAFGNHEGVTGNVYAEGNYSFVFGTSGNTSNSNHIAVGDHSFAFGNSNKAKGSYSMAFGHNVNANSLHEINIGSYGSSVKGNPTKWIATDRIFNIANGEGTKGSLRSDAFTILKNGTIIAPSLDINKINLAGKKALANKEFVESLIKNEVNQNLDYSGSTGMISISDGNTVTLHDGDVPWITSNTLNENYTGIVQYNRKRGIVTLKGGFTRLTPLKTIDDTNIYTLPDGFRPTGQVRYALAYPIGGATGSPTDPSRATIWIQPDGKIRIINIDDLNKGYVFDLVIIP